MRTFKTLYAAFLLSTLAPLAGCASETGADPEATESDEAEVKKKVKPKGSNGAFELGSATWNPNGLRGTALGTHSLGADSISVGGRLDRTAGSYEFSLGAVNFDGLHFPKRIIDTVLIEKGKFTTTSPTGLLVRYDRPINLGTGVVLQLGDGGWLSSTGEWAKGSKGVLAYVAPRDLEISSNIASAKTNLAVPLGKLAQLVLPTSTVTLSLDTYDSSYPDVKTCSRPFVGTNLGDAFDGYNVRDAFGKPEGAKVVPQGDRLQIVLDAYGIKRTFPASADVSIVLNRLEVDDVEVTSAGGQVTMVPGIYDIDVLEGGVYHRIGCSTLPTHSGIDLPDGTYRITSVAQTAAGRTQYSEEISFP